VLAVLEEAREGLPDAAAPCSCLTSCTRAGLLANAVSILQLATLVNFPQLQFLQRHGADINMRTGSVTALDLAVLADNKDIVQELGAEGTALTCQMAIQHDNAAMLHVLLYHFADMEVLNHHCWEVVQQYIQHCRIVMLGCHLACQCSFLCSKPNKLLNNVLVVCQHSQIQGSHAASAHDDVCAMALQKLQLREVD